MFLSYIDIFLLLMFVPAAAGMLAGMIPNRIARNVSLVLCCISCASGIASYPMFLVHGSVSYEVPVPSAWGSYSILIDGLTSIMISVSSLVFMMVVFHMFRSGTDGRYNSLTNLLFLACMVTMCADQFILLLIAWEMVTVATFLMSYSGKGEGARWKFFVITHFGGMMVLAAFIVMYMYADTGTLSAWNGLGSDMGSAVSCIAAVLLFMGFGAKLGLIPLHAWMPDMYAHSPTHTSALLSTVSSNAAVLVLFKSVFVYIGVTPDMYAVSVPIMAIASATAIWGALESLIQTEPKRILAYSSMENMALVVMCFSLAMLFVRGGSEHVSVVIVAGMFHAINHSVFKSLMFMTVGTIEDSTGETAIEKMGGLAKMFPVFSVFALIAVMSMAAIPPFNGFASEWLMIRSMMGGGALGIDSIRLILPMGVAVLGISGMMAAVSYTRMYGFVFLGRPRSDSVAKPRPISFVTYIPLAVLASACVLLGLFSVQAAQSLGNGIASYPAFSSAETHIFSSSMPLLAAALAATVVLMYALCRIFRKNAVIGTTWNCGTPLEDNMQYSSIGFTQPLVRVFHPLYGDSLEIVDDKATGHKKYSVRFSEPFVEHLYEPLGRMVMSASRIIGRMQNGSIQTYIGYILAVTVILLLAVSL